MGRMRTTPRLPSRVAGPDTLRHRRQLAAWLFEWQTDRRLREACGAERAAPPAGTGPSAGRSRTHGPGQIVLLPPAPDAGPADRPLYVLVLAAATAGTVRAAPFGRFAVPATPGEWRTGLRAGPLRVLCLWNARRFPRRLLEAGWRAGRLNRATLIRALALDRLIRAGGADAGATTPDIGPPLVHPLDPRHEYLRGELEILEAALTIEPAEGAGARACIYPARPGPMSNAAGPPTDYGV